MPQQTPSVNITAVALGFLERGHVGHGFFGDLAAVFFEDGVQGFVHVRRHARGTATDVEEGPLL